MTKEELEKEARINLKRRFGEFFPQLTISYVMGAEPREKRIEELEKENKVLAQNLEDTEIINKALEKENAELKKLKRECETSLCRAEYQYNYEQLTKAKELLAKWVELYKPKSNTALPTPIQVDTEQFLNEVEK